LNGCHLFIQGIRDFLEGNGEGAFASSVSPETRETMLPYAACNVPSTEEIRKRFLAWARESPNYQNYDAAMNVWIVITKYWPCVPDK
jgi:hypothetical protein